MANFKIPAPAASGNPTLIDMLESAWQKAHDAMNAADEFSTTCGDDPQSQVRASHANDGQRAAYDRSDLIQNLIVREMPMTWRDAIILAAQLNNIGCDIDQTTEAYRADAFQSLTEGLQNLLTFLTAEVDVEVGSTLQSTIDYAERAVMLRTGRAAAAFAEAA